jgi:hypothetical protein
MAKFTKRGVCRLCGARHKHNGKTRGGVIRVDSRRRAFSIAKRRAKFRREKIEAKP